MSDDKDVLRAIFGQYDHRIEQGYFEVADDIDLRYYDGGSEIDLEATLDKILASDWLAERVRAAQEAAWDEGAEVMAAQEGIAPDRELNPYRKKTND